MDLRKIKKLIELVEASEVGELEIRQGEETIRIARSAPALGVPAPAAQAVAPPAAAIQPNPAESEGTAPPPGQIVKSPMVGTFYRAPAPTSRPFVEIGDRVEVGDALCIIEAMKLMNEIEAETAGTVKEILVRNEEPVEYGQVLFRIDPG